jgi:hypothetical protein
LKTRAVKCGLEMIQLVAVVDRGILGAAIHQGDAVVCRKGVCVNAVQIRPGQREDEAEYAGSRFPAPMLDHRKLFVDVLFDHERNAQQDPVRNILLTDQAVDTLNFE